MTVSNEIVNGEIGITTYYFAKEDRKLWKQEINVGERKMIMEITE